MLVHLLLRADSINRRTTDWRKLKVNFDWPGACDIDMLMGLKQCTFTYRSHALS
jgi:hypothetical protein